MAAFHLAAFCFRLLVLYAGSHEQKRAAAVVAVLRKKPLLMEENAKQMWSSVPPRF